MYLMRYPDRTITGTKLQFCLRKVPFAGCGVGWGAPDMHHMASVLNFHMFCSVCH